MARDKWYKCPNCNEEMEQWMYEREWGDLIHWCPNCGTILALAGADKTGEWYSPPGIFADAVLTDITKENVEALKIDYS